MRSACKLLHLQLPFDQHLHQVNVPLLHRVPVLGRRQKRLHVADQGWVFLFLLFEPLVELEAELGALEHRAVSRGSPALLEATAEISTLVLERGRRVSLLLLLLLLLVL